MTESQTSGNATTLPTEIRFTSKCVILSPVSVLCSDYCPYSYMWVYSCFADLSETEIMRWFDTADVLEFLHNVVAGKVL